MKYLCGRCIHIDTCLVPRSTGCVEECKYFKEMPSHLPKQTNEEWLRSIGTRELAKELALLVLYDMPLYDRLHNVFEGGESAVIDECEKWLKEKHDEM